MALSSFTKAARRDRAITKLSTAVADMGGAHLGMRWSDEAALMSARGLIVDHGRDPEAIQAILKTADTLEKRAPDIAMDILTMALAVGGPGYRNAYIEKMINIGLKNKERIGIEETAGYLADAALPLDEAGLKAVAAAENIFSYRVSLTP